MVSGSTNVEQVERMLADEKNVQVFCPIGDWFLLTMECGASSGKELNVESAVMERVTAWQHVQLQSGLTQLEALVHSGRTHEGEYGLCESAFVFGDDRAPNGQLWRDVYEAGESTKPGRYLIKDLSVFICTN